MADTAFARSVARWLRAYPRRWRTARGDEVTALLADLAPAGARRLDLRPGLGLLRGGVATRWREHPPLLPWLGYVVLGRRLPLRYREWAQDDIDGPWSLARQLVIAAGLGLLGAWLVMFSGGLPPSSFLRTFVPMMLLAGALHGRRHQEKLVTGHLVLRPGEVVTPGARIHALVPRARTAAAPTLLAGIVVAATALGLGTLAVAVDPTRIDLVRCGTACVTVATADATPASRLVSLALVLLAGSTGVVAAVIAAARLRRWIPTAQPGRVVVTLDAHDRWRTASGALGLGTLLALNPGLATAAALPLAVGAALLLPVLVTARTAVVSGRTRARAAVEVRRALVGSPDHADRPVAGFLPATTWLAAGTVAPLPSEPDAHEPSSAVALP